MRTTATWILYQVYLFIWTILGSWSHGPILRRTGDVEAAEFRGKVCKGCNSTELLRFFADEVDNWFCSGNSHSNFKYLVVFSYFPKQWTITGEHGKNMKTTVTFILFILLWCIIWARIEVYTKGAKTKAWRNNSHHIESFPGFGSTNVERWNFKSPRRKGGGNVEVSGNSGRKLWL